MENNLKQIEIIRKLRTDERIRYALQLYEFARSRVKAQLRYLHPNISNQQLEAMVRKRFTK